MNSFIYILIGIVITISNIDQYKSAPVADFPEGEAWKTPCSGTAPTRAPLFTIPKVPTGTINDRLNALLLKTKDTIEISQNLQQKLKTYIDSDVMINALDQHESLRGFPPLTSAVKSLKENLNIDYDRFARVYIFVEQSTLDSEFKTDFKSLASKLLNILCELKITSSTLLQDITTDVNRDIMLQDYRSLNLADRSDRDYIIVKDILTILLSLQPVYTTHIP